MVEFLPLWLQKKKDDGRYCRSCGAMSVPQALPTLSFQGHKAAIYTLCQGLEPGTFLSAGGDGIVVRWQLDAPHDGIAIVHVGEPIFSLLVLERTSRVLIGTGTGRLLVVDLLTKQEIQVIQAHSKGIFRITFLNDHTLACAGGDGVLSIWRLDEGTGPSPTLTPVRRIPLCEEKLRDIVLTSDRERMLVACGDGTIREFDLPILNEQQRFGGHEKGANCTVLHPSKPALVSGGKDGHVKVWRTNGQQALEFAAHKGSIYSTTFDPQGRFLVTAGRDALLKVWDASTMDPVWRSTREKRFHTHSINALLWLDDVLLTASDDRRVQGWEFPA